MLKVTLVMLPNQLQLANLAAQAVYQKTGVSIDIYHRTAENLVNTTDLNEFIYTAEKTHIAIIHLTDGKKGFPGFDQVVSALGDNLVPLFASDLQSDPEIVLSSTVDKKDYRIILDYIKSGGAENFENLLCFLANHYADGDFEVTPPKELPLKRKSRSEFKTVRKQNQSKKIMTGVNQ
jgi:cobalamin biosynthesis Mg chelatase CobN